ncbi:MAG: hypothetical protein MJY67_05235 [Bacteroidales bacterium]|nr:hypothetical protein [Bacteroidales bacterium]
MEDNYKEKREEPSASSFTAPVEDIAKAGKEYVDLKVDQLKLTAVEGLSVGLGRFLSGVLIIMLVLFCCIVLTMTLVLVVGEMIGSYAIAAAVASALAIALTVAAFCVRKTLFVNGFVKLFANMFFDDEEN